MNVIVIIKISQLQFLIFWVTYNIVKSYSLILAVVFSIEDKIEG